MDNLIKIYGNNLNKYLISRDGNIYSNYIQNYMKPNLGSGYPCVNLIDDSGNMKTYKIHHLMAKTFIQAEWPDDMIIDHINGNKLDNRIENLRIITYSQNTQSAYDNGLVDIYKRSVNQYSLDGKLLKIFDSMKDAEDEVLGYRSGLILRACKGDIPNAAGFIWKYNQEIEKIGTPEGGMEILGYENYIITKDGKIYSKNIKRWKKAQLAANGYLRIGLNKNGVNKIFYVHILIAEHFIPNPDEKYEVNHLNKNKLDNRVENLQWVTNAENVEHASGRKIIQMDLQGNIIKIFPSIKAAGRETGISNVTIFSCLNRKNNKAGNFLWKNAECESSIRRENPISQISKNTSPGKLTKLIIRKVQT